MHTTFVQHLQSIQCVSPLDPVNHSLEASRCSAILGAIEAALHVAGTTSELQARLSTREAKEHDGLEAGSLPRPPLDWSHVTGFFPLIGGCAMKWGKEILTCDRQQLQVRLCTVVLCFHTGYEKITLLTVHQSPKFFSKY